MNIIETYEFDEAGYLYVGWTDNVNVNSEVVLEAFRRNYVKAERRISKDSDLKSGYVLHVGEMESFDVEQKTNKNEYDDAVRIWSKRLPEWAINAYAQSEYVSHIAFRDHLHEGVYECLTKFKKGYLYWYHG